jgi:PadR family transcriptional regulator PadR
MTTIQGDQLRGHLEGIILAALETGPSHGLGILHHLEERGCGLLKLKEGSLYPALYRLEATGLVRSSTEPVPAGQKGAPRRVYALTGKGKRALQSNRKQWRDFASIVSALLGVPLCPAPSSG